MPKERRTNNTSSMLFFVYNRQPLRTQEGMKQNATIMATEYKQCPNGHYYQGDHCPYCKTSSSSGSTKINETDDMRKYDSQQATETFSSNSSTRVDGNATIVDDGTHGMGSDARQSAPKGPFSMAGHTVFGDEEELVGGNTSNTKEGGQSGFRVTRKLVGWLVSYTLDPLGVDFRIYEGRNIIGRDPDCNITVNDNWVSSKHSVLLFRAGKYSISDSMSAHGTFVNDTDIELEPFYLQDGDTIKIGQTIFKFRTAF